MKLGTVAPDLKNIHKIIKSLETPLQSADMSILSLENWQFLLYQEIQIKIAF